MYFHGFTGDCVPLNNLTLSVIYKTSSMLRFDRPFTIPTTWSDSTGKIDRLTWVKTWGGRRLALEHYKGCRCIDLIDPDAYITASPARRITRQCINENLLGDARLRPTIRRTETIRRFMNAGLRERCQQVVTEYTPR